MMVVEVRKWCRLQVVGHSKLWCSGGYGSVGEHEMRSDQGSRNGETRGGSGRAGWLDGEEFVKVCGFGVGLLQGVVG